MCQCVAPMSPPTDATDLSALVSRTADSTASIPLTAAKFKWGVAATGRTASTLPANVIVITATLTPRTALSRAARQFESDLATHSPIDRWFDCHHEQRVDCALAVSGWRATSADRCESPVDTTASAGAPVPPPSGDCSRPGRGGVLLVCWWCADGGAVVPLFALTAPSQRSIKCSSGERLNGILSHCCFALISGHSIRASFH